MVPLRLSVDEQLDQQTPDKIRPQFPWLDELFEQVPEAAVILSADDRVLRVNREFTRLFGYRQDEVVERPIHDLIVPEDLVATAREYTQMRKDGGRLEADTVRKRKDGTQVHVSILTVRVNAASGDPVANYTIYRDITERKYAEEQLRESEARFQAMADTAPVLIWMTGTDGLCNYFNKPWLEFTGRTMEQEVGTGWIESVHPDDVQGCFDGFLPAYHARKPFSMEYRLKRADGEYRWLLESGIPRYTGAGDFEGYIGSNIDITDLKLAAEERERLRELELDLAHVNRVNMMGELAASLAHEVKQPIAAAVMNAAACETWLKCDPPNIPEACEAASAMIDTSQLAATILDRVGSLYRRGASERKLVDLNELIGEMIGLLRDKANRALISIRTELDPKLPLITADRVQTQQVFMNLMLNGIEAMKHAGGELTVTSNTTADAQALIAVSDSGVGLPAADMERVFEAFFTTKSEGTGMGLSISRRIIESHGGRLWATPNAGHGAIFHFTLPSELTVSSPSGMH